MIYSKAPSGALFFDANFINFFHVIEESEMKTTLDTIRRKQPCGPGFLKLLRSLPKEKKVPSTEISLRHLLKSNGAKDTVWALRAMPIYEVRNLVRVLFMKTGQDLFGKDGEKIRYIWSDSGSRKLRAAASTLYFDYTREECSPEQKLYLSALMHWTEHTRNDYAIAAGNLYSVAVYRDMVKEFTQVLIEWEEEDE